LKNLERISLSKSRFVREEAVVQRRVEELTCELEAAGGSVLHECERAIAAEQGLTTIRSALSIEQEVRTLAEG
jgi:hypothetical protein